MTTPVPDPSMPSLIDPVCGMTVTAAKSAGHVDFEGQTYDFCGLSCVKRLQAEPQKVLEPIGGDGRRRDQRRAGTGASAGEDRHAIASALRLRRAAL